MNKAKNELGFEASIEAHLLGNDWVSVPAGAYDARLGVVPSELVEFLKVSQPDEWEQFVLRVGGGNDAKAADKVVAYVAGQIDERGTLHVLRNETRMNGVAFRCAFFAPANSLVPELRERYQANRLGVARQVHFSVKDAGLSLDTVLFINGLPVATVELKNPLTGQTVEHAMRQYRYDRDPAELIFRNRAVVHFAADTEQVYMTTKLAGKATRFLPFNQGSNGPGVAGTAGNPVNPEGHRTDYLWEEVWDRSAWLALFGSFVHVEDVLDDNGRPTGDRQVLFPRYHQWDVVTKMLAATRANGPGVNYLGQHSAGSGKSNSIGWLAHSLSRLHTPGDPAEVTEEVRRKGLNANEPIFHKVIVVTDRRALDRQLQQTVGSFEHTPGVLVRIDDKMTSADLKQALESNAARIIITTLQKFPVVAAYAAEEGGQVAGKRFAVIVDEAHSSTSGEAMKQMKQVLSADTEDEALTVQEQAEAVVEAAEVDAGDLVAQSMNARGVRDNVSFYAFTATPKPKTLELFGTLTVAPEGSERKAPFHLYSMRQAVDEGFILDVLRNYTTYATYYNLANTGPDDPEVPVSKASAALARFVTLHPTNLAQKSEVIVEHFRSKVRHKIGGRAKAMVVTRSRLHAVRYKEAIDRYLKDKGYDVGTSPVRTLVAFSGTVTDPAAPAATYTEVAMNGMLLESQLPAKFASDDYQVLVVAEKYQTGFDQPLLHTMYVDKPLAGVKAVQTLQRLNRIHADKDDTFILDFANDADDIREAFRPFFEETSATPTDPNILYGMRTRLLDVHILDDQEMARAVQAILEGKAAGHRTVYANLDPAVERFKALEESQQVQFRDTLTSYLRAYSFLAQVMSWTDADLEKLFVYGKALQTKLPPAGDDIALPMIDESIVLTHLRNTVIAEEEDVSLGEGSTEPGSAFPNDLRGRQHQQPVEPLSQLIIAMNERFGMEFGPGDQVWAEQQKMTFKIDSAMRAIALNNDRDNFERVLRERADAAIVARHEANGELFNVYFAQPQAKEALIQFFASAYEEIRAEEVS